LEASGIISMELTVGSKLLATMFFVVELQGNYSVILGHGWIHTNRCVPSTLHQFLIQWVGDEIEVAHANALAYIALVDASANWQHGSAQCKSWRDISSYEFLSVTKDEFVPMYAQPASEAWHNDVGFHGVCKRILSDYSIAQSNISLIRTICARS
jgi:hypothetical protein